MALDGQEAAPTAVKPRSMGRRLALLILSAAVIVAVPGFALFFWRADGMGILDRFRKSPGGHQESNPVVELLKGDRWDLAEVRTDSGVAMIRFRTPVLSGREAKGYDQVLKVVWSYSPEGSGALPSVEQSARMKVFEDRFCQAVEHDAHAVLAAVLTFDGARQWVFYTSEVRECGARLQAMPQEANPYPVELTTEADPEWRYLHDEILKKVPWKK